MKSRMCLGMATLIATTSIPHIAAAQEHDFALEGEVAGFCYAANAEIGPSQVNFGILSSSLDLGSIDSDGEIPILHVCNDPDGFSRTISSQNNGSLVREGTNGGTGNEVAYVILSQGSNSLAFDETRLSAPLTTNHSDSFAYLDGETSTLRFRLAEAQPSASLFAGRYADVVTLSVIAN